MLFFLSLLAYASSLIKDCNISSIFRPTSLALTPDPPVAGEQIRMTVIFNNPGATVTDGTVTTSVTYNFLPITPAVEPLCDNTACPIVYGSNDRSTVSTWPDVRGTVVTKSVWTSVDGDNLLCIQTAVKVGHKRLRTTDNISSELFRDDMSLKQVAVRLDIKYYEG
jgi:hypothetical protein